MNDILELFRIAGKIDLKGADKASRDIDDIEGKGKGLGSKLGGFAKKAATGVAIATTAVVGMGTAAFAATNKVTAGFDEIVKHSSKLGIPTDAYQEMNYWASQNGISTGTFERAVGRLNQRIGRAADGNEKYADALKNLGIDLDAVRDGTLSTEDAMTQAIQALSEMETEQQKSAAASELFGTKLARDLMPALQDGSLSIEDAKKAAEDLGIVIGEDTLNAGVKFQDNMTDMKASMKAIGQNIMSGLIPIFNTMMDWVLANMPTIQSIFQKVFDVLGVVFTTATGWIQTLIAWLGEFLSSNRDTFSGIWQNVQEVFGNVVEFLQATWQYIVDLWNEHGQTLLDYVITVFTGIYETSETLFNAAKDIIEQVIGYIVPWVQEKLQVLQDFWAENGEQIMQAVENAFNFIKSVIEFVMPAIQFVVEMVWGIIRGLFDGALNFIMGLIKTFASLFTGDWEGLWEGVKQMLSGALEFVWNLINLTLIGRGIALIRNFATAGLNLFRNLGGNLRNVFSNISSFISNIVSRIVSSVLNFFRNMGSGIRSSVSNIFSNIRNTFNNIISFITGLGTRFFNAGKNIIKSIADGIKGAITLVTDAISGVTDKIRGFLPFSPAKEGPLKDINKLNFEGPISESIDNAERKVHAKMSHLVRMPKSEADNTQGASASSELAPLIRELIEAVREGQILEVDGNTFARVTGEYTDEEGGIRLRRRERGLA